MPANRPGVRDPVEEKRLETVVVVQKALLDSPWCKSSTAAFGIANHAVDALQRAGLLSGEPEREEENRRLRGAVCEALDALEGYLQGESGPPFTEPYGAARKAAGYLRAVAASPTRTGPE